MMAGQKFLVVILSATIALSIDTKSEADAAITSEIFLLMASSESLIKFN